MHNQPKKIFVCEFITAGGFAGQDLPQKLMREGVLMRDALLRDLNDVLGIEIFTTHDARMQASLHAVSRPIAAHDDPWQVWAEEIVQSDAVWAIAPETDGLLLRLAQLTQKLGKIWLGCSAEAIEICGDKLSTHQFLQVHGASITTFTWPEFLAYDSQYPNALFDTKSKHRYVAKPRLGEGCEDTFVFSDLQTLTQYMVQNRQHSHLVQLFLEGQPTSMSVLCRNGQSWVLSVNTQHIIEKAGELRFSGVTVNGFERGQWHFQKIADNLASWMPGLNGIIGVDMVIGEKMAHMIEINPRLTTSYAGLRQSIAQNPAKLVLDVWQDAAFVLPGLAQQQVNIDV